MKIVLDTNVLISALIRDSFTRSMIMLSDHEFYYPRQALDEIKKYESFILDKSELDKESYLLLLDKFISRINLIEESEILPFLEEAKRIMQKIDPKDVIFIACSLYLNDSIILSDDKHFYMQNEIKAMKISDLIRDTAREF